MPKKIFVGMETSGEMRRRFAALGHDVISCDILPSEDGAKIGTHIVGDVFETLEKLRAGGWWPDAAMFHPSCTFLTISAAWAFNEPDFDKYPCVGYHQKVKPGTLTGAARHEARDKAVADVKRIEALPIKVKALENPIGALSSMWRKPSQIVQPFRFGDDASKATCLWFFDDEGNEILPIQMQVPIDPTKYVKPRLVCDDCRATSGYDAAFGHGCEHCGAEAGKLRPRWANQTDTGQNRLSPGDNRWKDRSRTYPGIADAVTMTIHKQVTK
jgi:hypothetical protein